MRRQTALLFVALTLLGGCSTVENAALQIVVPKVTTANNALAKIAQNDLPKACATIKVAEGYYADVQFLVPQSAQLVEAAAAAIVNKVCANPPTNIVAALQTLNGAWVQIQAATTVPSK